LSTSGFQVVHTFVCYRDEADKLLEDSFDQEIKWINDQLPKTKQTLAFSATYIVWLFECHCFAFDNNKFVVK
jgi:superfamily II DNA/RNA helicase